MAQDTIRISVVSYLNAQPFMYGLEHHLSSSAFTISGDIPSVCAEKLIHNQADIGLIPVAMLPQLSEAHIFSSYCIAANGPVASVVLVSQEPLQSIKKVVLDTESRTSVTLAAILAKQFWNIQPEWIKQNKNHSFEDADHIGAAVIIGDKALKYKSYYRYCYDLSDAWKTLTGLPFVFAVWVSNKKISPDLIFQLEEALAYGVRSIPSLIPELTSRYPETDITDYLMKKIQYHFGKKEKEALQLFLEKADQLNLIVSGPVVSIKEK